MILCGAVGSPRQPPRLVLPHDGPPPRPRPPRDARVTVPVSPKRTPACRARLEFQCEAKRLPYVPTEDEIHRYYQTVWGERRSSDVVPIKTLPYTGLHLAELVAIYLDDVDLDACRIRVIQRKGNKDRVVPFPTSFI